MNLFLAVALTLQDPVAEETYHKIEATLEKAKTVTLRFSWKSKPWGIKGSGTLLLKEGGKGSIYYRFEHPAGLHTLFLVSDGSKMAWAQESAGEPSREETVVTPKSLMRELGIVRFGPLEGIQYAGLLSRYPRGGELDQWVKKSLHLSDFTLSKDENAAALLTYKIKYDEWDKRDVRLWYDPRTHKPLKRTIHNTFWPIGCKGESQTETREEFTLDTDIAEDKFTLAALDEMKLEEPKFKATRQALTQVALALAAYGKDNGVLPTSEQGLDALLAKPTTGGVPENWKGPYLKGSKALTDSWGHPFIYRFPLEKNPIGYYLFSVGPDGEAGTDDDLYQN